MRKLWEDHIVWTRQFIVSSVADLPDANTAAGRLLANQVFALRAFESGSGVFGWGFALFALAEITYMTYHVNITQFLFSHTIAEVLDGLAFVAVFVGAVQRGTIRATTQEHAPPKRR